MFFQKPPTLRRLSALVFLLSIFSLGLSLIWPERWIAAQSDCRVECNATVPPNGQVGAPVQFAATATGLGCAASPAYEWDFGDGSARSTFQNPNHLYTAPGTYNWRLTTSAAIGETTIATIAGGNGEEAQARQTPFTSLASVASDPQGRGIYLLDNPFGLIRFINTSNAASTIGGRVVAPGAVRAVAGGGLEVGEDTPGLQFSLSARSIAAGKNGELLFFYDDSSAVIRALNVSSAPALIAGKMIGVGNIGSFTAPGKISFGSNVSGMAVNPMTGELSLADATAGVNKIFRLSLDGAIVTTVAGNGAPTAARDPLPPPPPTQLDAVSTPLLQPRDLEFDAAGNLYVADTGHGRVVKIDAAGKITLARQYLVGAPGVSNPYPAALAAVGGQVYLANGNAQTIVRLSDGAVIAGKEYVGCNYGGGVCGDGGPAVDATFSMNGGTGDPPWPALASDGKGLYIVDQAISQKGRVRYLNLSATAATLSGVTIAPGNIETIAGSGAASPYDGGPAISGQLFAPSGVAVDANNNLYIADTLNARLRFVNRGANAITIFPNTAASQIVPAGGIVTINKDVGIGGIDGVPVNQAGFDTPQGLTATNQGLIVADSKSGLAAGTGSTRRRTGLIRFINTTPADVTFFAGSPTPIVVAPGRIATIAGGSLNPDSIGDGEFARSAKFLAPTDVAVNPTSGDLYIADTGNKAVRKISGNNGVVSSLNLPAAQYTGVSLDQTGRLYVANYENGQILRETSAGSGNFAILSAAALSNPRDVALDAGGNAYVVSSGDHRIVKLDPAGAATVIAGTTQGFDGDNGRAANAKLNLNSPPVNISAVGNQILVPSTINLAVSPSNEILFADTGNNRIRRIGLGVATCVKTGVMTISGDNPVPALTRVTPNLAVVGGRALTINLNGSGFVTRSKVRWNGAEHATTYISSTQLTAAIPATDLTTAGSAAVTVFNPEPGGGSSNALTVTVSQANPTPTLILLAPQTAAIGVGFSLAVTGSGFVADSIVQWNGSAHRTVFVSDSQLSADILASDLTSPGRVDVTVLNPEPGGGQSNKLPFTITATNAAPSLSRLSPAGVNVAGPGFLLQVIGSNFAASSKVRWNGQDRPTSFLSSELLAARIAADDLANSGLVNVTVFTPTPGGGVSNSVALPIGRPLASVPAASFSGGNLALESIVAAFGSGLSQNIESASAVPLPTSLGGVSVAIKDAAGVETATPLFFVSPTQINYFIPANVGQGTATVVVRSGNAVAGVGQAQIATLAPGIFSANATGQGVAVGVAQRAAGNGALTFESIAAFNQSQGQFVPLPIDLGPSNDRVFLILFGSGLRYRSGLSAVSVKIGGIDAAALFVGAAPGFVGLDQFNIGPIPRALIGRGVVDIVIKVDGMAANTVQMAIK